MICRTLPAVAILLTAIASLLPAVGKADDARRPPNIVFILADDLGINDLGCYGRKDQNTPHLDRLASEGMRFTSAYCAQPICSASRAAFMTGKAPARLHLTTFLPGRADAPSQKLLHPQITQQLPLEETTLAEHLAKAGYATACVGKWHLGNGEFGPQHQGFQFVHAGKANTQPSDTEGGKGEYDLTDAAIRFVEENQSKPFFLYVPHNNPHIPLAAKQELIEKNKDSFNPIYAAVVETLDDSVGRLMKKLDELKLTDNTIFIFTSDNGGLHVLEGSQTPATHNTPFRAGKGFVYEGGTRIPLIVRYPGVVAAGKTNDTPVVNTDWLPTLLHLCGANVPAPGSLDGVDISPALRSEPVASRTLFWHFPHYTNQGSRPAGAVRDGQLKLVEHYDTGEAELYDLKQDLGETKNLAAEHPDKVAELRKQLAEWRKHVGAQENTPNPDFRPELFNTLYVETDVSKLQPAATAAQMEPTLRPWRETMNSVVRKNQQNKKGKNKGN